MKGSETEGKLRYMCHSQLRIGVQGQESHSQEDKKTDVW